MMDRRLIAAGGIERNEVRSGSGFVVVAAAMAADATAAGSGAGRRGLFEGGIGKSGMGGGGTSGGGGRTSFSDASL